MACFQRPGRRTWQETVIVSRLPDLSLQHGHYLSTNTDSTAYHLWTLIGTYNYLLYSGDGDFVREIWAKYTAAMEYSLATIASSGIVNVTGQADWGRWTYSRQRASASML